MMTLPDVRKTRDLDRGRDQESIIDLNSGPKAFNTIFRHVRRALGGLRSQPEWRAFVSWEKYYQPYLRSDSAHAVIQHTGPLVGDTARQLELINGVTAGRAASLIWGPPGCGKSRLALELARRLEKTRDRWQVLFVQHDYVAVREEIPELAQLRRIVFVVDDAHDCPELVKALTSMCAAAPSAAMHLVCLTRSSGRATVGRALQSAFPPGAVQEMDLGRPSTALVRTLIDGLLPKSSPHHRDTVARFVRQSYFGAVLVCNLLNQQRSLPQTFQRQDLHDKVCREPFRKAAEGLCTMETALRALSVYAALSPVQKADSKVQELAAQLSALERAKLQTLIERLLAAGLFTEYAPGLIRPTPDLLGDLILEEACLDFQGKPTPYSKQLLDRLFEMDAVTTVRNCADIGQLFGTVQDTDLISGLLVNSARTISADSKREAASLLLICQPIAARRPSTVVEVIRILETRGILRPRPPEDDLHGTDSIEIDAWQLLMRAGEADTNVVPIALQWGRNLHTAARADTQSAQRVLGLLQQYCRFNAGLSVGHAKSVVDGLQAWVAESDVEVATVAATLSSQFLRLDVQSDSGDAGNLSSSGSGLSPTPDVWAVRGVAVDMLARAVGRTEPTIQHAVLTALGQFAESRVASDPAWTDRWRPQLDQELQKLREPVSRLSTTTQCLPVWAAAERLGWHWWTREADVLHRAGKAVLICAPRTDAYQLWKLLHSQQLPVLTVLPEDDALAAQGRLAHLRALSELSEQDIAEQSARLFEDLGLRHSTPEAWRALWRNVLEQTPAVPLHALAGVVIGEFARRQPSAAWSFINEADAESWLFPILTFLLVELGKQDRARRSEEARKVRPGTRLEEAWLRALWSAQDPEEAERRLLGRGLNSSDLETVHRTAATLLNTSRTSPSDTFQAVFTAISRHPADAELWDLAIEHFVRWASEILPPESAAPTETMARVADSLITLMQGEGSQLRWGFQPYTRHLPSTFAIFAIVSPTRLQEWMQTEVGRTERGGTGWNDESPLSVNRLRDARRLIRDSPRAPQWIEEALE